MVRTALSQVHPVHTAARPSLEPTSATSGFQGHYYFIPVCSTDTALTMFYGLCGEFCLFFFKFTFDGSNQTRSSGVNLTSD